MWTAFVDLVRATLFAGSHFLNGSLGGSILLVTALVRLSLIPPAVRAARHARIQQAKLAFLKPQLDRIQKRHATDRLRMMQETQALHQKHGIGPGRASVVSMIVQVQLFGGLFSALRSGFGAKTPFLWVADLGRADILLLSVATGLAGLAASSAPVTGGPAIAPKFISFAVIAGTLVFLWSASSAVALSVATGSAVSVFQNWMIRRDARRALEERGGGA